MRLLFLFLFFGLTTCFAQKKDSTAKVDSLDMKVISQREMVEYLERINKVAMNQFTLAEQERYQPILNELRSILADVERKRKGQK